MNLVDFVGYNFVQKSLDHLVRGSDHRLLDVKEQCVLFLQDSIIDLDEDIFRNSIAPRKSGPQFGSVNHCSQTLVFCSRRHKQPISS